MLTRLYESIKFCCGVGKRTDDLLTIVHIVRVMLDCKLMCAPPHFGPKSNYLQSDYVSTTPLTNIHKKLKYHCWLDNNSVDFIIYQITLL